MTMKLDLEKQKLFFKDNDPDRDPYDVFRNYGAYEGIESSLDAAD